MAQTHSWTSSRHLVDWNTMESSVKPYQVRIYPIAEQYAAGPVPLSDGPSLVYKTFAQDVVDNNNGDVVTVDIEEETDHLLI